MNPEFLSGEASASPAVEPLLAGARALAEAGFGAGSVSARNGPRTTTHGNAPLGMLTSGDFIEVADYDPHLDRLLCIGKREPHPLAGMHAIMMRAKKEVGAIVMVEIGERELAEEVPRVKRGRTQLDHAMAALEALRHRDSAIVGGLLVVTALTPAAAFKRVNALLGA